MDHFTPAEYADIVFIYGFCNGNSRKARGEYSRRYPNRRIPSRGVFARTFQRLRETGTTHSRSEVVREINVNRQENVVDMILDNPRISTRRIAAQLRLSQNFVWRTLNTEELHPYHFQRTQALEPGDAIRRLRFCEWVVRKLDNDPTFATNILWSDESTFTRDGINNFHNEHIWSIENTHAIRQTRFQRRFSINVWAGILNNRLFGVHFLDNRMNAENYLQFLNNILIESLDDMPLDIRIRLWYQQDGAPPHNGRHITEWLTTHFRNQWIGNRGPVSWPPRSPDLNPLDFYFWGHLKQLVYSEEITSINHLRQRINDSVADILDNNNFMARINATFIRRVHACIRAQGGHFEHIL